MEKKVMNRWIIVVGAILIQLCLGAIYAWSVFTPPLVAPLPDVSFENDIDAFISVTWEGDLEVGKETDLAFSFTEDGNQTMWKNITLDLTLMNDENKAVKSDKVIPVVGYVYDEGEPITLGPYIGVYSEGSYTFEDEDGNPIKVKKGGNWHFTFTAVDEEDIEHDYEVMFSPGTGDFGFSKAQTQMIFALGLFTFGVFTIIGGKLTAKFGPRKIAILGGVVLGAGYMIGGAVGTSFVGLLLALGLLGGAGIGLAYVVPIGVAVKWFPDKKGMISGLAVAGFGFGALLWMKLLTGFKFGSIVDLTPGWNGLFGSYSISQMFFIYGIAFLVAIIAGGLLMINPPEGWKPKGWNPPEQTDKKATGNVDFTPAQMRKTAQYKMLFIMFIFGAGAGLMTIGVIKLFGTEALVDSGKSAAEAGIIAGTAMAFFFSLANGIGRIAWGAISDKIGRRMSFVAMFGLQGVMMLIFYFLAGNEYLLYAGAAIVGFNFGGNFSLFPAATADYFGNKTVGQNYGFVFFAYGIGGILGPIMGGVMGDNEAWMWAFIPAGILLLACAGVAFMLKPPEAPEQIE